MTPSQQSIIDTLHRVGRLTIGDLILQVSTGGFSARAQVKSDVAEMVKAGHLVQVDLLGVPVYSVPSSVSIKPETPEPIHYAGMHGRLADMISVTAFAAESASLRLAELQQVEATPAVLTEIARVTEVSHEALRLWTSLRWDVDQVDAQGGAS